MRLAKYTGAGNDFLIAQGEWTDADASALARRVCPRSTGAGVDGLILLHQTGDDRVAVRFVNPDGSIYSTCGNGTRCAARFAVDRGLVSGSFLFIDTPAASIEARVSDEAVELLYDTRVTIRGTHRVNGPDGARDGWLVDIGVPHFVLPVDEMPQGAIEPICRPLRDLPEFGTEGANINLVRLENRAQGAIRSFERGVEGETLACGSGAMAAGYALNRAGLCDRELRLSVRGGATLRIGVPAQGADPADTVNIALAGPAVFLFDAVFSPGPAHLPEPMP